MQNCREKAQRESLKEGSMNKMMKFFLCGFMLNAAFITAQPMTTQPNFAANPAPAGQIRWLQSYSEAVALSQSTSKPIVILFTGTGWCPACMRLEREVINNPEFAQGIGQKFVFLKAEFPEYSESSVMASPFKSLLDRYGVNSFPTIVVINANGQRLSTVNYRNAPPSYFVQELLQSANKQSP